MSKTPLRDRRGQPMTTYTATDAKNAFGEVLEKAGRYGAVAITKHDKPRFVVIPVEEYVATGNPTRDAALQAFHLRYDEMFAQMQTDKVTKAGHALFGHGTKRGVKRR